MIVLESVAVGWLWLLAVVSLVVHCAAMAVWIPVRRFRISYPFVMAGCGAATIVAGRLAHGFSVAQALVLVSSALIGLTVGLLPLRREFMASTRERNEDYKVPPWRLAFCLAVVSIALLVSFVLAR